MPPVVRKSNRLPMAVLWLVVLLLVATGVGCCVPSASAPANTPSQGAVATQTALPQQATDSSSNGRTDSALQPHQRRGVDAEFERISLEQGLSQSVVLAIFQDSQGFMWFGTQDGLNRYDGYEFVVYKHDPQDPHSLSNNLIWAIHEDDSGALWIGTNGGGLDRFDRMTGQFIHYQHDPNDPQSLSNNNVVVIHQDREGVLWIGTNGGGLDRLERESGRFFHHQHDPDDPRSLSDNSVQAIYEDRAGALWVGTSGGGLNRLVSRDAAGSDGESTTATGAEQFERYRANPDEPSRLSHDDVLSIHEDGQGALWIGTNGGGLNRLDRETGQFVHYRHDPKDPNSLSSDQVWAIHEDQEGNLWVGTFGGGLDRLVAGDAAGPVLNDSEGPALNDSKGPVRESVKFVHHQNDPNDPSSLSNDQIWSLYEDRLGVLWVGTFGSGVNRFDRQQRKFIHYRADPADPNSLSDNVVWSFLEDEEGTLWIGTSEGLNRLVLSEAEESDRGGAPGQFVHYQNMPTDPHSLSDNLVWSIYQDREGEFWVGTLAGLDRLDRETGQFVHYQALPVFAIHEDGEGTLWIGTWGGGLGRLNRETDQLIFYKNDPADARSLADDSVVTIRTDREGTLWVGTFNGGLNRLVPDNSDGPNHEIGRFVRYQHDPQDPQSLSHNTILALHEDQEGVFWIATGGGGLNKLDRTTGTFTAYREKDGLPNDTVYGILEDDAPADDNGLNLWLSTNRGLSRFNPRTETFRNYDVGDGLQSNEFNQGSYYRSRSGEMFFGGVNGFNAFYPEQVKDNPHIPPIVLTALTQGGEPADMGSTMESATSVIFRWPRNFFEFEFAALNYSQPEKNRYAYVLEGFDADWIETGTRRFGQYTNLPGGTYTLRMKGSNNDGLWNEVGSALEVTIVPPFWATWWFRGLAVLVLTGVVIGGYRLRIRSVEARSRELAMQVANRTKELGALNAVTAVVSRSLDLKEILNDALDMTLQVMGIEAGGVYLLDENAKVLALTTYRGFGPDFAEEIDLLQVGEGFSGHVVQSGQALVVRDVATDERLTRMVARDEGFHSLATVPLSSKGKVLGTLFAVTRGYREFTGQDVQLLTSIGHQIGIALENAHLFEAEQRRAEQFRLINQVGRQIISILAVDELLQQLARAIQEVLGYDRVSIGLFEREQLVLKAVVGPSWDPLEQHLQVKLASKGVTGWIAHTGQQPVPDTGQEPQIISAPSTPQSRAELAVPLKTKEAVIGVLNVESFHLDAFDESDTAVLQSLAHQAAIAIENARLYEDASTRLAQLAALQETTRAVASTLELEKLLNLIIQQATTLLQADAGLVNLVDWERQEDEVVAAIGSAASILGQRSALEGSLSGWVALHNEPLISNQVQSDSRVHEPALPWVVEGQIQSAALAPLTIKEQVMGTLVVTGKKGGRKEFAQPDLDLLVAFANQAATAIENAQLFEAEQRRAEQFRLISEVGRHIITVLDVDLLLDEIAHRVSETLGYYLVGIGLIEDDKVVIRTGVGPYWQRPEPAQIRLQVGEHGIVGAVAATGKPLLASDVSQEPGYFDVPGMPETKSELAVPMMTENRVIGVLDVQSRHLDAFDESDVVVLQALANQAAVAIEKARLLETERQRADEMDALRTTLTELTAELELSTLLQSIVERAAGLLAATGGELALYDEAHQLLRIVVSYNLGEDYVGTRHRMGEGAMGRVAQIGESLIVEDYQTWEGRLGQYPDIHATLAAPLKVGGRLVGVLTTVTTDPDRRFTSADLHLLNLFAQQAAIAIENARLYEQAQRLATVEERQRLARDLHDSVTQALYAMRLYSEAAAGQLSLGHLARVADHLRELQDTAQEALTEMRLLIYELRPPVLEEEGLIAALQARLAAVEGRIGLNTELVVDGEIQLPPDTEEGLYRIAQEALNNALKHAHAHNITVSLRQAGRRMRLEIADDGLGFDPDTASQRGGLGLAAMGERAAGLGGRLHVNSAPGQGTQILVEVSL